MHGNHTAVKTNYLFLQCHLNECTTKGKGNSNIMALPFSKLATTELYAPSFLTATSNWDILHSSLRTADHLQWQRILIALLSPGSGTARKGRFSVVTNQ